MIEHINCKNIIDNVKEKNFIPCKNVSDKQIEHFIKNNNFIDVLNTYHSGYMDDSNIHAQRIASICNLIQMGVKIHPVIIYVVENNYYEIDDGHHRLRAFYYMNKPIPVILNYD